MTTLYLSGYTRDSLVACIFDNTVMKTFLVEEMILQSTAQVFCEVEAAALCKQWEGDVCGRTESFKINCVMTKGE